MIAEVPVMQVPGCTMKGDIPVGDESGCDTMKNKLDCGTSTDKPAGATPGCDTMAVLPMMESEHKCVSDKLLSEGCRPGCNTMADMPVQCLVEVGRDEPGCDMMAGQKVKKQTNLLETDQAVILCHVFLCSGA